MNELNTIEHAREIIDYCLEDEHKDFCNQFNLDDVPRDHVFDPFQKNHIYYHLHKMWLALEHEVRSVLVLSTAHITKLTSDLAALHPNYIGYHEHGAYFYVGDAGDVTQFNDPEDYPPDLYACLLYARLLGCDEIKFDADGTVYDDLRQYEW